MLLAGHVHDRVEGGGRVEGLSREAPRRISLDPSAPLAETRAERVITRLDNPRACVCAHGFSQAETRFVLSLVKGSRRQLLQRSRSCIPAMRAIKSSSADETERNGIDSRSQPPSTSVKWCDTSRWVSASYSSTPTCVSLRSKTLSRSRDGTPTSITNVPPGSRCADAFSKHATCASC